MNSLINPLGFDGQARIINGIAKSPQPTKEQGQFTEDKLIMHDIKFLNASEAQLVRATSTPCHDGFLEPEKLGLPAIFRRCELRRVNERTLLLITVNVLNSPNNLLHYIFYLITDTPEAIAEYIQEALAS